MRQLREATWKVSSRQLWPRYDGEMGMVEDFREVEPARDFGERVGPDDEEQLRGRVAAIVEFPQRGRCVGPSVIAQLDIGGAPAGPPRHRERDHREAVIARGAGLRPVRRDSRWHDEDLCQSEGLFGCLRRIEMTLVNRIERAAEDADASSRHRCRVTGISPSGIARDETVLAAP